MNTLDQLPNNLPVPTDDGACDHLKGAHLPNILLLATNGETVDLSTLSCAVVYCYPMTGRPDVPLPDGWDFIKGARGCTPQSCAFRDHYESLSLLGAQVFGLSTQTSAYQQEACQRLHLPYALLSDADVRFANALQLPTLVLEENPSKQATTLLKRMTFVARYGVIEKVFYPVFPPQENAMQVLDYLQLSIP